MANSRRDEITSIVRGTDQIIFLAVWDLGCQLEALATHHLNHKPIVDLYPQVLAADLFAPGPFGDQARIRFPLWRFHLVHEEAACLRPDAGKEPCRPNSAG